MKAIQLKNRSLIVRLSIGTFIGNPRDKAITNEATSNHNMTKTKGSFRKRIMQGDELNAVLNCAAKARKELEVLSLPWTDGGFRLIPSVKFVEIKQKIETLLREFETLSAKFVAQRQNLIYRDMQPSPIGLGSAFNIADYPNTDELQSKFYADLKIDSIPVAQTDWRIDGIDAQTQTEIEKQIESGIAEKLKAGKVDLLTQASEVISHLGNLLKDSDATFKINSIEKVLKVAATISDLNITEDATLAQVSDTLTKTFSAFDADKIREDKTARECAAKTCEDSLAEIEKTMAGIF